MAHGDRLKLEIKNFGEKVVIVVNRGKIECSPNNKKATITYTDSKIRGRPKGTKVVP
jgi:hypothetical protein